MKIKKILPAMFALCIMFVGAFFLTACGPAKEHKLTFVSENTIYGSVSCQQYQSGDNVENNASVTVIATANAGYEFVAWESASQIVCQTKSYTFNMPTKDYALTAKFQKASFQLTYDTEDTTKGTVTSSTPIGAVKFGQSVTITATALTGYDFEGWFDDTNKVCSTSEYTFTMPSHNYSLIAKFKKVSFQLSYASEDTNKGTVTSSTQAGAVRVGQSVTITATALTGYDFEGWFDGVNKVCSTSEYTFTMPSHNYSLTAKFVAQKRSVVYYDGYTQIYSSQVDYGTTISNIYTPVKLNFEFIDWFTDQELQNVFDKTTPITQNTNLYAKWQEVTKTYQVEFVDFDGKRIGGLQTVEEGESAIVPANPSRAGYTFVEWACEGDFTNVQSNLTVTATYEIQKYNVTFFLDEDMQEQYDVQQVEYMQTASRPSTPTKTDFVFLNWLYDGNVFDFENKITEEIELIAQWKEVEVETFTVNFFNNTTLLDTQIVESGSSAVAPATPQMVGFVFTEWDKDFSNVTENLNVYAQFDVQTFEVVFEDFDGTILKELQTVNYGEDAVAPEEEPTRTGYDFAGWDKSFENVTENLTITATYTIQQFTATFFDGSDEIASKTANFNTTFEVPTTPQKAGFSFVGWFKDAELTQTYDFNTPATANISIYAKFAKIEVTKYTVKFISDGQVISEQIVVEGYDAIAPGNPSKIGHTFKKWNGAFTNVMQNVDVIAEFDVNVYDVMFFEQDGETQIGETQHIEYNQDATPPTAPPVTGKTFKEWSESCQNITQNTKIVAIYDTNLVEVTFVIDGKTQNKVNVSYNSCVSVPNTPTKPGCIFKGWFSDEEYQTTFNFNTPITAKTSIYAKWEKYADIFTVTFFDDEKQFGNVQLVAKDSFAIEPAPPENGKEFKYWSTSKDGKEFNFETEKITQDLELYAVYED